MAPETAPGRPGQHALAAGVAAIFGLFVPGIGEFITVPASLAALVLGLAGLRQYEHGRSAHAVPATIGTVLGVLALVAVLLVALATRT